MLFIVLDQMEITTIIEIKILMSDCFLTEDQSWQEIPHIYYEQHWQWNPVCFMIPLHNSLHILMNSVWLTIINHIVFMICMMLKHLSISKRNHGLQPLHLSRILAYNYIAVRQISLDHHYSVFMFLIQIWALIFIVILTKNYIIWL